MKGVILIYRAIIQIHGQAKKTRGNESHHSSNFKFVCVSSSILPHTAGVKMRRDNVRLRYKTHVNMYTVASGWQIL